MLKRCKRWAAVLALALTVLAALPPAARAQNQPYVVFDAKPVILHGPYLLAPTENSIMIAWATDTPSDAKVRYGTDALDQEAAEAKDGLLAIGTMHAVRLAGLSPGRIYRYRVVSTRVVRMKGYWPDRGLPAESAVYTFRTFDRSKAATSFSVVTDTHEDVARIDALMKLVDWSTTDFLVQTGDAFNTVDSADQVFEKWLDPIGKALGHTRPLLFARGNHESRGAFARNLFDYIPNEEGHYYFARDDGPVHLISIDTGEDKPDATNVYAGLNDFAAYRDREFAWLEEHVRTDRRVAEAPFRIIVMHQPRWGYVRDDAARWTKLANQAGVDLIIAGHTHRFAHINPVEGGNHCPILVIGQDQVARVDATVAAIKVVLRGKDGHVIDSFQVARRAGSR